MTGQEGVLTDRGRQWWFIGCVAFAAFMTELDSSIVYISLPTIARYFNVSPSLVAWVVLAYLLIQTNTMLIFGKLADVVGLKRIFVAGYAVFIAGSLLCGLSQGIAMLIFSRCVQAIGGAMIVTSGYALVPRYLPKEILGTAFGILGTAAAVGVVVGAPVGGFITGLISWHWIFLINVPVGIGAVVAANRVIAEPRSERIPLRDGLKGFDALGGALSFLGILGIVFALNMGQEMGWTSPSILICFFLSLGLLVFFVLWERKRTSPILDLRLFRNPRFAYTIGAAFMAYIVLDGTSFLLPFYLETVKGLDPSRVGLVLLAFSLAYIVAGPIGGRLSDRMNPGYLCTATALSACVCVFVFSYTARFQGLIPVLVFLVWFAMSYAVFISAANNLVMGTAPVQFQGVASGVFNTTNNLGLVFGVCFFETIFSASMPKSIAVEGASLARSGASVPMVLRGFENALIFGGICLAAGFVLSLPLVLSRRSRG